MYERCHSYRIFLKEKSAKKSESMSFANLAKRRYSCRKFTSRIPSKEELESILSVARLAPSAKNLQPWKFIVVNEEPLLSSLKKTYARSWLEEAPVIIAVCGDHGSAWTRDDGKVHTDIDVAIAIDHLTLAATDKGMGTCWICKFDAVAAAQILSVPDPWEVIALIPIGFPADTVDTDRHGRLRKSLDDIIDWNGFTSD